MHNQSEEEDGSGGSVEDGGDARDGLLSPGKGELRSRERDSNDRVLFTIETSTSTGPAMNGTREMCDSDVDVENDTRGTGDGQVRQVTDTTASDSGEPNCNIVLPSAEGEGQGEDEAIADDGLGGPETTALAALSVVDSTRRRADVELPRNGHVAGTEDGDEGKGEGEGKAHSAIKASLRSKLNDDSNNWRAPPSPEEARSPETSPASSGGSTGTVATGADCEQDGGDEVGDEVGDVASAVRTGSDEAMGADDFLPLFALVLVSGVEMVVFLRGQCALRADSVFIRLKKELAALLESTYGALFRCVAFDRRVFLNLPIKVQL